MCGANHNQMVRKTEKKKIRRNENYVFLKENSKHDFIQIKFDSINNS